jgi:phosphotransferase system IIB component
MTWVRYVILLVILIIIAYVVIKGGKRDFKIEANKLVELLGGKSNIISIEANLSRFKATLNDVSLANKDGIQKLGARGIVEIDNQLKIVFDNSAVKLKRYIDELMKQNIVKR